MQVIKISRKERIELMNKRKKDLDFIDRVKRRELEGAIKYRLTEKVLITIVSLLWLVLGLSGPTPMCEIFCIPFAILTLFGGLWIV
ncbi:hypothetical protein [Anaerococcus sp. Marseille-P3915]|uniref:hypothetical protein n=1 Tax=Anaerococcus sp. Marseille-P3915 TaxID=2057799 RepID=UPI000D0B0F0D|nr:hypothetical protein [Anaerococcus sp. Marseille-P3915]